MLLPWRIGWRGAVQHPHRSLLMIVLSGVLVAAAFAAGTVNVTGTFTAADTADMSMGRAEVLVRSDTPASEEQVAPEVGKGGVTNVVQDLDIELVVSGTGGSEELSGRLLAMSDPLTEGMLVRGQQQEGRSEAGLSPTAMRRLGVEVGDPLTVANTGVELVVTDEVSYAADTTQPIVVIDPEAITATQREAIMEQASLGSPRWLLSSDDLQTTLAYVEDLDLRAMTRAGASDPDTEAWLDLSIFLPAIAAAGVIVMAAGGAALARGHRHQAQVLVRLGASARSIRGAIIVESWTITAAGIAVGVPMGLGAGWLLSALLQRVVGQEWGQLEPDWLTFGAASLIALILAPVLTLWASREPSMRSQRHVAGLGSKEGSKPTRASPSVGGWLLGARLAQRSGKSAALGGVAIIVVIAVGVAALLVVNVAQERAAYAHEPPVPRGVAALGLPRQLTDAEVRHLGAATNSSVMEDRRPAFTRDAAGRSIPVVVNSDLTECLASQADATRCAETTGTFPEPSVAVVDEREATGLLGRQLTDEEQHALLEDDGLLLAPPDNEERLVPPGDYQASPQSPDGYERAISPIAVDGFDYERYPGLLVSKQTMDRLDLFLDDETISYYILTPREDGLTQSTVHDALPEELADDADILIDTAPETISALTTASRAVTATSATVVFLIVVLLALTWANDSTDVLATLTILGMSQAGLNTVLIARGMRIVAPASVLGTLLGVGLTWAVSRYALVPIPISGIGWLLPALVAFVALPAATTIRTTLDRDHTAGP